MKKQIVGYTCGAFDIFHIGHLNLIKNAKGMCDKLIVGVSTDELIEEYKNKKPAIPYKERSKIIKSIKYVDKVVPQTSMDKCASCKKIKANLLFVGDDWYGSDKWKKYEKELKKIDVRIIYFPYTASISSTIIKRKLKI